jgi:hypothetical protein
MLLLKQEIRNMDKRTFYVREEEDATVFRKVGSCLPSDASSYVRRTESSTTSLWKLKIWIEKEYF